MTTKTRKQVQDMTDKHDAYISKIGQKEAARYLRSKEVPPTRGNIRAGIAFMMLMTMILIIFLAL
jgi:hypothetical protein